MSDFKVVKTLKGITFQTVYSLVMRYVLAVSTDGTDREETVKAVRLLLDEFLIGPKYSPIRKDLVKKYYFNSSLIVDWHQLHLFLDCVLDNSWIQFSMHFLPAHEQQMPAGSYSFHFINLIKTIIDRCPQLKEISITSCFNRQSVLVEHELLIAKSFSALEGLTKLKLDCWMGVPPSSDCLPFFTHLGKSCPKLVHLELGQYFPFNKEQVLALVLGEKVHLLTEPVKQQMWNQHFEFDSQYLTPFCSTLEYLSAHSPEDSVWSCAFILRHLLALEILSVHSTEAQTDLFSKALMVLLKHSEDPSPATIAIPAVDGTDKPLLKWTINPPSPLSLNLKTMTGPTSTITQHVSVSSSKMMKAVSSLCPRLKSISLAGCWGYSDPDDVLIPPGQVEDLFTHHFRLVEEVQFYNIPPVYCQAVLKGIGRQLLRLSFNDCLYIDLTNLLPCIQLEQLDFDSLSTVRTPTAIHFDGPFLPRLKKLVDLSSSCLGLWSSLIETERPLLTELRVHCAHIGISSVSHFEWTDIPTLWPNLRTMNVKSAKGLTLDTLCRHVLPRMGKLELLRLPVPAATLQPCQEEKDMAKRFQVELKRDSPLINVGFYQSVPFDACVFR